MDRRLMGGVLGSACVEKSLQPAKECLADTQYKVLQGADAAGTAEKYIKQNP